MRRLLILALAAVSAFAQYTPKIPAAAPTDADLGVVSYRATTTLAAGINSSVTSLTVAAGTGSKFAVNNFIVVDSEFMLITAISTDTFTVSRGFGGTTPASHSSGAAVVNATLPDYHNRMRAEMKSIGVWFATYWDSATSKLKTAAIPSITNAMLANPSVSVNGTACTLGSSCTIATGGSVAPPYPVTMSGSAQTVTYSQHGIAGPVDVACFNGSGARVAVGYTRAETTGNYDVTVESFAGACYVFALTAGGSTGSGANANGYYFVSRSTNAPTNAVNLGSLTTGLLKHTVSGGVSTPATADAGTDYLAPAAIGVTVQPFDSDLSNWANKTAPSGAAVGTSDAQTLTNKTLAAPAISSPTGLVKGDVGLGNVDNTSDATKNSATATLTNKTLTLPIIGAYTVATLPTAGTANRVAIVTDALTAGNCNTGGGSARALCRDTGSAWESLGDGGSASSALTVLANGTSTGTASAALNLINGTSATISCSYNSGTGRNDCTINFDTSGLSGSFAPLGSTHTYSAGAQPAFTASSTKFPVKFTPWVFGAAPSETTAGGAGADDTGQFAMHDGTAIRYYPAASSRLTGAGVPYFSSGFLAKFAVTDDTIIVNNGTAPELKALADCTGTGKAVTYNASTNSFGCNTISGSAPSNYTTNSADTRIGAGTGNPTSGSTLEVYDATVTTGTTKLRITMGAGAPWDGNAFGIFSNAGRELAAFKDRKFYTQGFNLVPGDADATTETVMARVLTNDWRLNNQGSIAWTNDGAISSPDVALYRASSGVLSIISDRDNTSAFRDLKLRQLIVTTGTEGTCDSSNRGRIVFVAGGAGVADTWRMCRKDGSDAYAFTALF